MYTVSFFLIARFQISLNEKGIGKPILVKIFNFEVLLLNRTHYTIVCRIVQFKTMKSFDFGKRIQTWHAVFTEIKCVFSWNEGLTNILQINLFLWSSLLYSTWMLVSAVSPIRLKYTNCSSDRSRYALMMTSGVWIMY